MKKIFLLSAIFAFISCQKEPGSLSGVATYFFNDYQGYKPDVGASVYVTPLPIDTIEMFSRAVEVRDCINGIERDKAILKDLHETSRKYKTDLSSNIQSMESLVQSRETILSGYPDQEVEVAKSDSLFFTLGSSAYRNYLRASMAAETLKGTVDGAGNYNIPNIRPGIYNVIFVSQGRTRVNVLEGQGCVRTSTVLIKSKQNSARDVKFEL